MQQSSRCRRATRRYVPRYQCPHAGKTTLVLIVRSDARRTYLLVDGAVAVPEEHTSNDRPGGERYDAKHVERRGRRDAREEGYDGVDGTARAVRAGSLCLRPGLLILAPRDPDETGEDATWRKEMRTDNAEVTLDVDAKTYLRGRGRGSRRSRGWRGRSGPCSRR